MLNSYKINFSRYGHQERNRVDKHDVSCQSNPLIRIHKQPRDIHIIRYDQFRATPNHLASDCSEVRAKYCVSIFNVVIGDGAVFKYIETYHSLKIVRRRSRHHSHEVVC